MSKIRVIALVGRSGVGKTSLFRRVIKEYPSVNGVISLTTRDKREGEENALDYHYVKKNEFLDLLESGSLIENIEYAGNYYGLRASDFKEEGINIVVVEPTGLKQLLDIENFEVLTVFIEESDEVVLNRLMRRRDRKASIKRFKNDKIHFANIERDVTISSNFENIDLLFELFE